MELNPIKMRNIGKNIVLCGGKIIAGPPDQITLVLTMNFLYILVFTLWSIFISPMFGTTFLMLLIFIFFFMLYNYLKCFLTDPGIIPRNHYLYSNKDEIYKMNNKSRKESGLILKNPGIITEEDEKTVEESKDADVNINNQKENKKKIVHMFSNSSDDPILFNTDKSK
jgi:hypothetical protein